jgi:hypothetical protein
MPSEAYMCDMHRAETGTGSESFIFTVQIQKSLPGSTKRLEYPNWFSGLQIASRVDYAASGSPPQSKCPSLNKRRLPRLASPGEALGQRINLIVVATGE